MLISTPVMLFHSMNQILIILSTGYFQVCSLTLLFQQQSHLYEVRLLLVVDTTAAPTLYMVGQ